MGYHTSQYYMTKKCIALEREEGEREKGEREKESEKETELVW